MSYVSVLKNIPEFLSQPAGIAAIASVGIHGAIAFILPLMPVDDSKPKQKEETASVGIMELSQAEQNRLPQTKRPQISALPKIPLQPGITLPGFATQPTPLTKLPPSPDSTTLILPTVPKSGTKPSVSSSPRSRSLPVLPRPNINPSFNANKYSSGLIRRNYEQPTPNLRNSTSSVPRRSTPLKTPTVPSSNNLPVLQRGGMPGFTNNPAPLPVPPAEIPGIANGNSVAVNPIMNPANNGGVNKPRRVRNEDFVAPINRNIPKPGDDLTLAGQKLQRFGQQSSGNTRIARVNQPSGNITTNTAVQNSNISPKNSTLALAQQFNEVKQRFDNVETKPPISEVIKAKPGKEGKVEGTIVVDSRGKVDYFKYVDRSVGSKLDKETRNYFRKYIKENRDSIRKNGTAKVYAFTLDFKSDAGNTVEFSKPQQENLADRLRDAKDQPTQKKPENISRSSAPVKINVPPSPGAVVVPTQTAPVKIKPQVQIRTKKPASAPQNNDKKPLEVRLRNSQEMPKVPSIPKPQARVNVKEPAPQATSKPSIANRLRNVKKESEGDSKNTSDSTNKLLQRLRKIQENRENSN
ncbi:MAG: hypothetical protein WBF90_12305 [Rivularia sp. (in: cyanobacteria)]